MKLTKATVDRLVLPPGKEEMIVFDEALPGFGLRIRAGGKRTWIAQYRLGSKQRRLTLGTVETLDPDKARQRAKSALSKAHLGSDPQVEKAEARAQAAITFSSVVDSYLRRYAGRLKASTFRDTERYLKQHWGMLGRLPIQKVTRADVAAALAKIAEESGGVAANRARTALGSLYAWAIAEGLADANPVVGTRKAVDEVARDRVLTDAELKLVWQQAGEGDFGDIIRLLILTGQRREEVAAMTWAEVDLDGATWRIGGERTKNSRSHEVPLAQPASQILGVRSRRDGRALVFGSRGPFSGWSRRRRRWMRASQPRGPGRSCSPGGCMTSGGRLRRVWPTWASCLMSSRRSLIMRRAIRRASPASTTVQLTLRRNNRPSISGGAM